ncbi:hypothetical protein LOK49_LG13G00416 [Camellia lanceoleosa]|uniref:Uncharacterized protein n=1 Tax=Camellia lanceoleosa TaxID=1840588 RepID=A0ACC0FG88_9ERIC|nr:hypothetical protein LOK49_LG13G00416 [Camellia lanceoleosa]
MSRVSCSPPFGATPTLRVGCPIAILDLGPQVVIPYYCQKLLKRLIFLLDGDGGINIAMSVLRYQYQLPGNSYTCFNSVEEEEHLEKLLEALGTDNLALLVNQGMVKTPTIIDSLYKHVEIDSTLRYLFAYHIGLYFMTNCMIVKSGFGKYENPYTSFNSVEDEEHVEKLLEALETDNLALLVNEGIVKTPIIIESLYNHVEIDSTLRHLSAYHIVLYFMTNCSIVKSVFGKYGEIERHTFDENGVQILFKQRNSV